MTHRRRLMSVLWRWHGRVGLLAAFFVLLLATTGIALNHSAELGLDRRFVDWPWLSRVYGDDSSDLPAFQLGERWLSQAANGDVYVDAKQVAPCSGKLVGAVALGELLYAGCTEELLLITGRGELVESVNASTGLPDRVEAIGLMGQQMVLQAGGIWWQADLDLMDFRQRATVSGAVQQRIPGRLPESIRVAIPASDQWLSWERLLLDVHSGRVVGRLGVLWMDAVGVLLVILGLSGIVMWWLRRRRRARKSVA